MIITTKLNPIPQESYRYFPVHNNRVSVSINNNKYVKFSPIRILLTIKCHYPFCITVPLYKQFGIPDSLTWPSILMLDPDPNL